MRHRLLKPRLVAANAAEVVRGWLAWRPRGVRRFLEEVSEIASIAGLRRRDVLLLAGLNYTPSGAPQHVPKLVYAACQRLGRVRTIVGRLEASGYVEADWTVSGGYVRCVITDSGTRVARAVRRALGEEDYPGKPAHRPWWIR